MSNGALTDRVTLFIGEQRLLTNGDSVVVALSGGADSVALLSVLISLKEKYNLTISAAHLNHGIRGEEADRDESFVKSLCAQLRIPLFCETADIPALCKETGESEELCGRRVRYDFLQRVSDILGGAKIATAHHRGDNAETVLWNLTRGAGIGGLSGIPAVRGRIIRPLLCCSRDEIERYCAEHDLRYVTDSTNLSADYTRNRLRHQVMPVLRELNPAVEEHISQTAFLLREADEYLNYISNKELNKAKTAYGYSCERLLRLEPIILRYAVKNLLQNADAPVDFQHIALIIEAMRSGGAVELGGGCSVLCAQGILRLTDAGYKADKTYCVPFTEYVAAHGTHLSLRGGCFYAADGALFCSREDTKIYNLLLLHCIPCDIITPDAVIRHRSAGDTFTDARRGVTKTLKKLLNELRLPRERRDSLLVIAAGSVILWLEGYGTSAQAQLDPARDGEVIWMNP